MQERESVARVCPVSDLVERAVSWLWPGRLPLGKLAVLEGDPGLGKSLVTLDLCARLSRGLPFPDGSAGPGPCCSLVLNAEDGEADTIRPRLAALGADLARVFVLQRQGERLSFPSQLAVLDDAIARAAARLVVIDPLLGFLDSSVASGNDLSIRRAIDPLARLADRYECAMILVRHLNKGRGGQAIYRGGGAIGLIGACRSGWLVGRDPVDPGQCVLAQVKNNLATRQASLAYAVTAQDGGPPRLSWLGTSPWSADELVAGLSRGRARARAREFLRSFLQEGPRPTCDIWAEGRKHGLSHRTLHRAKQELQIRSVSAVQDGRQRTWWLLPGQEVPGVAGPGGPDDLEPWLAPLREAFPPSTPLDEE